MFGLHRAISDIVSNKEIFQTECIKSPPALSSSNGQEVTCLDLRAGLLWGFPGALRKVRTAGQGAEMMGMSYMELISCKNCF